MENIESPSTPKARISNNANFEVIVTPLNRKPLSQITNIDLKNHSSAVLFSPSVSSLSSKCRFLSRNNLLSSQYYHPSVNNADNCALLDDDFKLENKLIDDISMPSTSQRADNVLSPVSPVSSTISITETKRSSSTMEEQSTPKPFIPYNPFEVRAEVLHLPAVSPSLFKEVVSPSEKEDTNFEWAINNLAILRPAHIESLGLEMEIPQDPEYERKAQEAIDRFFSNTVIVPSPWTNSNSRSLNLMSALFSSASPHNLQMTTASPAFISASREDQKETSSKSSVAIEPVQCHHHFMVSTWSQTELTLPPVLPKEVEALLAPFCTFTQEQAYQNIEESDDLSALNNTTLRRKLLFSDERSSAPRISNSSVQASSEIELDEPREFGFTSPTSTGPLPLDEEEEVLPWGVSMIRPSSRVSPRHPLSSPLQSSLERTLNMSPSPSSDKSLKERLFPMFSPHEVSPIAYIPPKELRTLPSPSECYQTPSRRRFLASPKLSPIVSYSSRSHLQLKTPPVTVVKTAETEVERSPLEYPRGKRGRNLYLGPNTSASHFESTSLSNDRDWSPCENRNMCFTKGYDPNSQGFSCAVEKDTSGNQRTPLVRESHRLLFKTSPHFSSSPIKGNNSNGSSCRLDFDAIEENDGSSKFSDSPPVSPISWKSDIDRYSNDVTFKDNDKNDHKMDDESDASEDAEKSPIFMPEQGARSPLFPNTNTKVPIEGEKRDGYETGSESSDHIEVFGSNATSMDTDNPIYNEGSTLEEVSCGQDTGYQTGTSLQMTNQSNCLSGSTTSLSKESRQSSHTDIKENFVPFSLSKDFGEHVIMQSHKGADLSNH